MKRSDITKAKIGLCLFNSPEHLAYMIKALKLKNFHELASMHCDFFNLYKVTFKRYGKCAYTEFKINKYLVDTYDKLQPDCTFDDFITILYFKTDKNGRRVLPDFIDSEDDEDDEEDTGL